MGTSTGYSLKPLILAKSIHQELIDRRRDFHMNPEIGFDLERTAGIVSKELTSYGLQVKTDIGKTGVIADLLIPHAKKRIALRADMDALPIQELNESSYKSCVPMKAHLCGHDAHTAMLLGAAKLLSKMHDQLDVNIRFIFQPSEEAWPGGASLMIQEGALDHVDEIYGLHVWPTLATGKYGICVGPTMAQADGFTITVTGRGGHAAAPHTAIDPILIATEIVKNLQSIIPSNVNANDNAILTVTQIHGGSSYNAIPDSCFLTGTVRTYHKNVQLTIKKRIEEVVKGIASAYGGEGVIDYQEGYPIVYNHEQEALKVREMGTKLVGESQIDFPAQKVLFGEDFAYYTQKTKGCFIHLGCRNEAKGVTRMLHDPRFDIDEDCLIYGTAMHLALVLPRSS